MSLKTDLQIALDPVAFSKKNLGITPDDWQARVLRYTGKRIILNCSRQSGKSLTSAIKALHLSICNPGKLILLVSPSLRQSSVLFRVISDQFRKLKTPLKKLAEYLLSSKSRKDDAKDCNSKQKGRNLADLAIRWGKRSTKS